ncbi:MAG: excinuclease ABC subunit UvrB [Clostridia bacterium]|nr:excinuclease ABC subunit UvrB [Clostridia bacterium]MBR3838426.1 excinuclease ABC subunit UvrB [Clostridia bacterium]
MDKFILRSDYVPTGDQPEAISKLTEGIEDGLREQVLLGVTGSGKTFTMANIIANLNRPTLVLAHNKTLAGQLYSEFKEFFPDNCVEYFVSYYDYYQPEAYIPISDTYIEKDSSINDEIDRLRHSATAALFERRDVIIVASVSCIYGLGDPEDYVDLMLSLRPGMNVSVQSVAMRLVQMNYTNDKSDFSANNAFKIAGDTLLVKPAGYKDTIMKISFFGDELEKISQLRASDYKVVGTLSHLAIFPASHYSTTDAKMQRAISSILEELDERVAQLKDNNKMLEAYRLEQRTRYDMEMLKETKFCSGIENYSRHISGRKPGSAPYTLLDYFPKDFIMFIDESHTTVPQVRAMYNGDRARKESLVEYGFRLPSAFDNRPLKFDEFNEKINQVIYVSATPAPYEMGLASQVVEQIIRPTGLVDPVIEVRPVTGQIDNLVEEIRHCVQKGQRVLVTTLTKKMAEDLTDYFTNIDIKVTYLHSDIKALERMKIIKDLRTGEFDVLVGINLLREGLDIPEVALIAILDADKAGFLRSETALIQTIGRAARNVDGRVIMYADDMTEAMSNAIEETNRRRSMQMEYNRANNITPKSIQKDVRRVIETLTREDDEVTSSTDVDVALKSGLVLTDEELDMDIYALIDKMTQKMAKAASELRYEEAAVIRDVIKKLKKELIE